MCTAPGVPARIVLLIGSTGVGKTTLARQVVRCLRERAEGRGRGPVANVVCMSSGGRGYRFDATHWRALAVSIDDPFPTDHRCPSEEAVRLRAGLPATRRGPRRRSAPR